LIVTRKRVDASSHMCVHKGTSNQADATTTVASGGGPCRHFGAIRLGPRTARQV